MKNIQSSVTVKLQKTNGPQKWTKILQKQSILLFKDFESLNYFNFLDLVRVEYLYPLRLLIYCINLTIADILSLETKLISPPYYYFIIFDKIDGKIKLFTFENLNELKYCDETQQAVQINEFSASKLDWIKKPIFSKKYTNFYGCEMNLAIVDTTIFMIQKPDFLADFEGLVFDILKELSIRLNFTDNYYGCDLQTCKELAKKNDFLYNILEVVALDAYALFDSRRSIWNFVIINVECT